jgi:hypothetical protein
LDADEILNGSTEENIPTSETGLGITVIALVDTSDLVISNSRAGDVLVAVGLPRVGDEVLKSEEEIADLEDMQNLLSLSYIYDILPVGSKGVKYEAELLADINNLNLSLSEVEFDLHKSAGPATVLLATLPKNRLNDLKKKIDKTINLIAHFYSIK